MAFGREHISMKCWKCGQEFTDGTQTCVYCHVNQRRSEPKTEIGRAMRALYTYYKDYHLRKKMILSRYERQCYLSCEDLFDEYATMGTPFSEYTILYTLIVGHNHLGRIIEATQKSLMKLEKTFLIMEQLLMSIIT